MVFYHNVCGQMGASCVGQEDDGALEAVVE